VQLKHRIFNNFIAVVLTALAVFGLIAYQLSGDLAVDAMQHTLQDVSSLNRTLLSPQQQNPSGDDAAIHDHRLVLQVDANRRPVGSLPDVSRQWPVAEILTTTGTSGRLEHQGQLYLWSLTALPTSPNQLLYMVRAEQGAKSGLNRLASRLAVFGLLVIWVAVWVALILATMVSRRLEANTEALKFQANHDSLTGLPNRKLLHERLDKAVREAREGGRSVSLIMMDLDRFKEINDTLGHPVGDGLLQAIGQRMAGSLWGKDTIARLGGDEFALLLPLADSSHTTQVIEKVRNILSDPFVIDGITLEVEASLGVAVYPDDSSNVVELISHADVAMYLAKQSGAPVMRYDPALDPHSVERLTLLGDLRHAIGRNELMLYYQPKIALGKDQVIGVEALLRWKHPQHGLVPPDKFIPQAERTGIIKPLTDWVLNEALRQCAQWQESGMSLQVAINLSARLVQDLQLPGEVAAALARHRVQPEMLKIEITETAIMSDPARAMQVLTALDTQGIGLSIDDFGTGYTSLAQLKRLPVDEVKIDRSFVMSMLRDANDAMIVHSIIELAHNMNRVVVAEGVENKKVLDALQDLHCDEVQGYYFSRPLPAAEFIAWMKNRSAEPVDLLPPVKALGRTG